MNIYDYNMRFTSLIFFFFVGKNIHLLWSNKLTINIEKGLCCCCCCSSVTKKIFDFPKFRVHHCVFSRFDYFDNNPTKKRSVKIFNLFFVSLSERFSLFFFECQTFLLLFLLSNMNPLTHTWDNFLVLFKTSFSIFRFSFRIDDLFDGDNR